MSIFKDTLKETDSELFEIIQNEKKRQQNGLELIASKILQAIVFLNVWALF